MRKLFFFVTSLVLALGVQAQTEQPEGELKSYDRDGECLLYEEFYGVHSHFQSGRTDIVYAPDGKTIYLKNPIFGVNNGAWVQGTISDDGTTISIPLGQEIFYDEENDSHLVLAWGSSYFYDYDDDDTVLRRIACAFDETVTEATFAIDGETLTLLGTSGDINAEGEASCTATGLTCRWDNNGAWAGFMDWKTELTYHAPYTPHDVITVQPEGELKTFMRQGGRLGYESGRYFIDEQEGKMQVVFGDDGAVYFHDLFYGYTPDSWVKAQIDESGKHIVLPLGQYIYENEVDEYAMQVKWGHVDFDENGFATEVVDQDVTQVVFDYDAENGIITLADGTQQVNVTGEGENIVSSSIAGLYVMSTETQGMEVINFASVFTEFRGLPAVPANPEVLEWYDDECEDGYSYLDFRISDRDIDGNVIDKELMSYSIFTDNDQIFTFDPAVYTYDYFEEPMTEIPYTMWMGTDICGTRAFFYRTNAEGYERFFNHRIGIQVYYTAQGVKNASDIVYLEVFPQSGIAQTSSAKVVASQRYYNVTGQQSDKPFAGMNIVVRTYIDGTTSTSKAIY